MMRNLGRPKKGKLHGAEMANGDCDGQVPRNRTGYREEIRSEGCGGGGDSRAVRSEHARGLFLVFDQPSAITVQTLNVEGAMTFW
jgi:hypothetical protein